ncbi:MAG: DUF935 family protein [Myxococcota bacterium]
MRRAIRREERATTFVEPSVRTATQWSPQLLRSVLTTADGGNLSRLADLCDNLLADDRIGADMSTRAASLFALPFDLEGGGQRIDNATAVDFEVLNPPEELTQLHVWGRLMGVGLAELVYPDAESETGRLVPSLRVWHPKHLRYARREQQWSVRVGHDGATTELIEPGNGKWILYTPYGATRPWARGLWRGLALWWLLKQYARDDWGAHSEHAARLFVENDNEFDSAENREQLARDIAQAGRGGVVVPPSNYTARLVESSASTSDLFAAQIDVANTAITIAIRGQNLATEVQGGSFAAAQVHQDVDTRRLEQDAGALSSCLVEQQLLPYVALNFGAGRLVPIPTWDTSPPEDEQARASVLSTVAAGAERFRALGAPLDLDWLAETFGLVFDEEEIRLAREARQAARERLIASNDEPGGDEGGDDASEPEDDSSSESP